MNATKQKAKAHVIFDTRAKSTMLGLFTMISIENSLSLPNYQAGQNETTKDCLIWQFTELNEHYDNTVNEMNLFSFLTDLSTNEVFTFSQAMKQENELDFIDCNGKRS